MKKSIRLSTIIFLLPLIALSQSSYYSGSCPNTFTSCSSPSSSTWNSSYKRGVYVNYFFNFDPYDGDWDPTPPNYGVNTSYSVLCQGTYNSSTDLYSTEEDLLNYLYANNFTSICIYGVERMLRDPNHIYGINNRTIEQELRRFIYHAKTGGYGITEVSAVIGSKDGAAKAGTFLYTNFLPCPLPVDNTPLVINIGDLDQQNEPFVKALKTILAVYNFNTKRALEYEPVEGRLCDYTFDRMVTEWEWWNASDPEASFHAYENLMDFMHCVKEHSRCPLKIDTYMGSIHNIPNISEVDASEVIDDFSDRIYMSAYWCNPYNPLGWQNQNNIYDALMQPTLTSFTPRPTLFGSNSFSNTEIWPLLSAESSQFGPSYEVDPANLYPNWLDYLGYYLLNSGNMACAENYMLDDYANDVLSGSWGDNDLIGIQWFASGFMIPNGITRIKSSIVDKPVAINNENPIIEVYNLMGEIIYEGYFLDDLKERGVEAGPYILKVCSSPVFYKKVLVGF